MNVVEERMKQLEPIANTKGFSLEYIEKQINQKVIKGVVVKNLEKDLDYSISPCVYYENKWDNLSDKELVNYLISYTKQVPNICIQKILEKEYFLENIYPLMYSSENESIFKKQNLVYEKVENLLVVPFLDLEYAMIKINFGILSDLNLTKEEVLKKAFENLNNVLQIKTISEMISEIVEIPIPADNEIFVISNSKNQYGASAVLLPKTYEILRKKLGEKIVIFPSSIHECLAVRYDEERLDDFLEMV